MPNLRRHAVSAIVTGLLAAGAAYGLPLATLSGDVTAASLPAVISPEHPVRVVHTTRDDRGRPVVTVRTATDRDAAADLVRHDRRAEHTVGVEIDTPVHAAGTDPYRTTQWDFAEMRVADAWPSSTGAGVTVAVLDTGVDAGNPDLTGQVLPGADLITGVGEAGDDPNGHGTHVAGVIAALTGNELGVSSIAPDAKILPVRILDANGNGYLSTAAAGIVYAADHGADVINMSIAARGSEVAVTDAIAYARGKGVVVVAAAGNDRGTGSPTSYPAAEPGVIAVAATDANDAVAGYSTAGDYVDVAAPGTNILSTYPVAKGSDFAYSSGTSMAAPHVAAVAALLKARDRTLTPDQVEQAIESSAVDLGVPGRDDDFGYGRIDAASALAFRTPVVPTPTVEASDPTPADSAGSDALVAPEPADSTSGTPESADSTPGAPGAADSTSGAPGAADSTSEAPGAADSTSEAPRATDSVSAAPGAGDAASAPAPADPAPADSSPGGSSSVDPAASTSPTVLAEPTPTDDLPTSPSEAAENVSTSSGE